MQQLNNLFGGNIPITVRGRSLDIPEGTPTVYRGRVSKDFNISNVPINIQNVPVNIQNVPLPEYITPSINLKAMGDKLNSIFMPSAQAVEFETVAPDNANVQAQNVQVQNQPSNLTFETLAPEQTSQPIPTQSSGYIPSWEQQGTPVNISSPQEIQDMFSINVPERKATVEIPVEDAPTEEPQRAPQVADVPQSEEDIKGQYNKFLRDNELAADQEKIMKAKRVIDSGVAAPLTLIGNLGQSALETAQGLNALGVLTPSGLQALMSDAASGKVPMENLTSGITRDVGNWIKYASPENKRRTIYNLLIGGVLSPVDIDNIKKNPTALGPALAKNFAADPLTFTLDLLPLVGVAKGIGKGLSSAAKVSKPAGTFTQMNAVAKAQGLSTGIQDVQNLADYSRVQAAIASQDIGENLVKHINEITTGDLAKVIKSAEEGTRLNKPLLVAMKKALKDFGERYHKMIAELYPSQLVNPKLISMGQYLVRKNLFANYDEAIKYLTPLFENENYFDKALKITDEAKKVLKDSIGNAVIESDKLYDAGKIFPVTHAMAETLEGLTEAQQKAMRFAGRFSDRVLGTATYEAIAKALKSPTELIKRMYDKFTEGVIKNEIAEGSLLADETSKNIAYASKADIKAADSINDIPLKPMASEADDLAIDLDKISDVKERIKYGGNNNPYAEGSLLAQLWDFQKSSQLASGTYLIGNAQTALSNMLLNSQFALPLDVAQASKTGGRLSQLLGAYRPKIPMKSKAEVPILKFIDKNINKPIANTLQLADLSIQNSAAEIAAHNKLRSLGVPFAEREAYIRQLAKDKNAEVLSDIVNDIKRQANMPADVSILPENLRGAAGLLSGPFWRWQEDATRSTLHNLRKHPLASIYLTKNMLGGLGHDIALQNAVNAKVESDKPNRGYLIPDGKGGFKEARVEVAPQMTTLRLFGNLASSVGSNKAGDMGEVFRSAAPLPALLFGAYKGIDKNGRPIRRASLNKLDKTYVDRYNNKSYKLNENGVLEPIDGQLDSVAATALKELFSPVNLYNKTVAPIVGSALGTGYYQPYNNTLFGSYTPNDAGFLTGGDPLKHTTPDEIGMRLMGIYSYPFYNDAVNNRQLRNLLHQDRRRDWRAEAERRQFNSMFGGQ